jgi:hypothetical protein
MQKTLKSYFFWTHQRGSFHYDVMVTLILAFIFITPHLWHYGDKPVREAGVVSPTMVVGDGDHGIIVTVAYKDVYVDPSASDWYVRRALHQAIEPVTGDTVAVEHWETTGYVDGKPTAWKVWAHR